MNKNKASLIFLIITMILLLSCKVTNKNNIEMQILKAKIVGTYGVMDTIDEMDTVTFGSYPQSDSSGKKKDPIEWIVLAKDSKNQRALILSKYILDNVSFNDEPGECNWENSSVRKWLNNTFYENAFDDDEKEQILIDSHISDSFRDKGKEVSDNVFLLSSNEVNKYFKKDNMQDENKRLATKGTEYAKNVDNNGDKLWVRENTGESTFSLKNGILFINKVYRYNDEALKYEWCVGNSFYWLRTNGFDLESVARVNSVGGLLVSISNYPVTQPQGGIRPAIWVKYTLEDINKESSENKDTNDLETVTYGHYKQTVDSTGSNWKEDPIEWIVLEKDDVNKKELLISKYILDTKIAYHKGDKKNITWENTTMRKWLNETFYDSAFSDDEKKKIIEVNLTNDDNDDYMTLGGKDTKDKIFLLSISEARKYFVDKNDGGNKNQLSKLGAAKGTDYAVHHRKLIKINKNKIDEYEEWAQDNSSYFLRTPGGTQKQVAIVEPDAKIYTGGVTASTNVYGIRPAMWVEYK